MQFSANDNPHPSILPLLENWKDIEKEIPFFDKSKVKFKRVNNGGEWKDISKPSEILEKINGVWKKTKYIPQLEWVCGYGIFSETWFAFPLMFRGNFLPRAKELFPKTCLLLEKSKTKKNATSGFSILLPGGVIKTHTDEPAAYAMNLALKCENDSSCLVVSSKNRINRVFWHTPGEAIVFKNSYPHSAENKSKSNRVILYTEL